VTFVTEDNDVQNTEAFVRQVVDRIQGVIEALEDYQLELYVRSQNPKDLEVALKHASIYESFTSTRGKRTETEANDKTDRQLLDEYGGRVRSVTEDNDIQITEAFITQVVDRIQ